MPEVDRWLVNREDLAWAAGFFDGEGCFSFTDKAAYASVSIVQVERGPLDRFMAAVGGLGKIYGPYFQVYPGRMSTHPWHQYRADRREHVQAIAAMLWFKLGDAKRIQALTVLKKLQFCRRGHRLGAKRNACPQCTAEHWARYRKAHPASRRRNRS